MNIKDAQNKIKLTEEIVAGIQNIEFRKLAFSIILNRILNEEQSPYHFQKTNRDPEIEKVDKTESKENGVLSLEIKNSLEGFPNLYKLQKGQQILWLLAYCDQNKISSLSSGQVSILATRFKLNIPVKHVTTLNKPNLIKGYVAEQSGKLRILQSGIDLLNNIEADEKKVHIERK